MALAVSLLSLRTLTSGVLIYILFRILYQIIHYRFFHPLAKLPGPFWASVTRLWITYHSVRGDEVEVFRELHKKHGSGIRVTPTMLLVDDATMLPLIYHRAADKSQHYISGTIGPTEALFNMQPHKTHARHRKIAAAPYSFTNIKKMEPLIDAHISHWIFRLDTLFASTDTKTRENEGKPFDFCPWAVYMAYDVVSEVGFGAPFGFVAQGRDVAGLIKGMHDGLVPFGIMVRMYPLTKWIMSTWVGQKYLVARPDLPAPGLQGRNRARREARPRGSGGDGEHASGATRCKRLWGGCGRV
ncbi:hypothetical protein QQX98_005900 [Neonectria punicea]|uniref:Cytochrome P450 n=1 Tax=Neonectria punicea TaxID=979145 RepID=A0ABR1H2U9_9HYPO